jgi:O-antigen/teichoic acid export membrane protein
MLGLSLFSPLVLEILAPESYLSEAPIIPLVSLAYAFYAARIHFESPIYIARRTMSTVPVQVGAVVLSLALNALLVPWFGGLGAAGATLLTFMAFAGGYYALAQRTRRVDWPIGQTILFAAVCIAAYLLTTAAGLLVGPVAYYPVAVLAWTAIASYVVRDVLRERRASLLELEAAPMELTAG